VVGIRHEKVGVVTLQSWKEKYGIFKSIIVHKGIVNSHYNTLYKTFNIHIVVFEINNSTWNIFPVAKKSNFSSKNLLHFFLTIQ
jgi:hypothetical protein